MKYMLDTNICIYIIIHSPEKVIKRFLEIDPKNIFISSITLAELIFGVKKSSRVDKNHKALMKFIKPVEILNFDDKAALEYGIIRNFLQNTGQPIGPMDTLIAAHAKSMGIALVTNNLKEFARIPNLLIENWA